MSKLERDGLGEDEVRRCVKKVPNDATEGNLSLNCLKIIWLNETNEKVHLSCWQLHNNKQPGPGKVRKKMFLGYNDDLGVIRTAEFLELIYTTIDWPLQTPNLKVLACIIRESIEAPKNYSKG